MKHIFYVCFFYVLVTSMTSLAIASDKPEMVSKDKLLAISMMFGGNIKLGEQLPDSVRGISIPPGLELFATLDFQGHVAQLFFVSSDSTEKVTQDLTSLLASDGWKPPLSTGSGPRATGFVSASRVKMGEHSRYCHPDIGSLNYMFKEGEYGAVGWLRLQFKKGGASQDPICNPSVAMQFMRGSIVQERFPVLMVPDDVEQQPGLVGGGGGGGDSFSSRATIATKLSANALKSHFADQLEFQGWSESADWSGDGTAGSVWMLDIDDSRALIGMLTIVPEAGDKFWLHYFVRLMNK